jgi:hypothetical protein
MKPKIIIIIIIIKIIIIIILIINWFDPGLEPPTSGIIARRSSFCARWELRYKGILIILVHFWVDYQVPQD